MMERTELLRRYLTRQRVTAKQAYDSIRRHQSHPDIRRNREGLELLSKAEKILSAHVESLASRIDQDQESSLRLYKEGLKGFLCSLSYQYRRLRGVRGSGFLRDDHLALTELSTNYSMLHATALAFGEEKLAETTLKCLADLTPLVVESGNLLPLAVVQELAGEDTSISVGVGGKAVQDVREAWRNHPPAH